KELILCLARTPVRHIVGVARPKVVTTPVVGLHLKDAVVVEAEHHKDPTPLRLGEHAVEPPRIVLAVMEFVPPVPLDAEGLRPHPDPDIVDPRLLVSREPIVVILSAA